ncbi:DUF4180 domain-containing protein [Bacillus horti]|uniref:DUF4180 domain-containing protein n=1 Tax=Caldalkalibacillus horti TaxID=77523 RepID=UPI0027D7ABCE|nr:DUF4180 domain-containing protein [Bacillus horti]
MDIKKVEVSGVNIAIVKNTETIVEHVQSALDLMATVQYEADSNLMVLNKTVLSSLFFELKTGIAGEILQKFINYRVKVAIVGDFSMYQSNALKDFIYECNNGQDIFFVPDEQEAIERLSRAR